MICWKIRIFAYWTTPQHQILILPSQLWFAEKFVSLLIEQHHFRTFPNLSFVVICWKIRIFAYWTTPRRTNTFSKSMLWFAEKFVSLLIEQHRRTTQGHNQGVVICWKIRIFAYWTTPLVKVSNASLPLWFAEKFVSLLIEQHPKSMTWLSVSGCDLLKNSYLCLLNNTNPP